MCIVGPGAMGATLSPLPLWLKVASFEPADLCVVIDVTPSAEKVHSWTRVQFIAFIGELGAVERFLYSNFGSGAGTLPQTLITTLHAVRLRGI